MNHKIYLSILFRNWELHVHIELLTDFLYLYNRIGGVALRRENKDWVALNHDNVFEWGDMSICGLLFQ